MKSIVIVEKTGTLKTTKFKEDNLDELYKKAGCKTSKDFEKQTSWSLEINNKKYKIYVYGKTTGRAGQENKYDFPPPIDNTLFFGSCVVLAKNQSSEVVDLSLELWKSIYETLFGGFEDIGDEDSEDEEEEEEEDVPRTKEGYVKDDFIVDDDEEEDGDYDEDEEDEDEDEDEDDEEEEEVVVPKRKMATRASSKKKKEPQNVFVMTQHYDEELEYTSELSEDSYD